MPPPVPQPNPPLTSSADVEVLLAAFAGTVEPSSSATQSQGMGASSKARQATEGAVAFWVVLQTLVFVVIFTHDNRLSHAMAEGRYFGLVLFIVSCVAADVGYYLACASSPGFVDPEEHSVDGVQGCARARRGPGSTRHWRPRVVLPGRTQSFYRGTVEGHATPPYPDREEERAPPGLSLILDPLCECLADTWGNFGHESKRSRARNARLFAV